VVAQAVGAQSWHEADPEPVQPADGSHRPRWRGGPRGRPPWGRKPRAASTGVAVAQFAAAGVVALVLLAAIGVLALRQLAVAEAVRQATTLTTTEVNAVVRPAITGALVAGDRAALGQFDQIVRERVISPQIVRVKLWASDGRVVYSDEPRLIGQVFPLSSDDEATLRTGKPAADLAELGAAENQFERGYGQLLQVYERVQTSDGTPLLFELYVRFDPIVAGGRELGAAVAPAFLLALVALEALQLPLAWRLAHRLRQGQREREVLNRRALDASDHERRRIARDLHDGVVQSLASVSYSLAAVEEELGSVDQSALAASVRGAARTTRRNISELRSLIFQINPPNLEQVGLPRALEELATGLADHGVAAEVDLPAQVQLPPEHATAVYRAAQEALRNVITHAGAETVRIALSRSPSRTVLTVVDDGNGFDVEGLRADVGREHFGLRLLGELARECGGRLDLVSASGRGTTFRFELPTS
jgi:two-component system, NarL family, sensor kinase